MCAYYSCFIRKCPKLETTQRPPTEDSLNLLWYVHMTEHSPVVTWPELAIRASRTLSDPQAKGEKPASKGYRASRLHLCDVLEKRNLQGWRSAFARGQQWGWWEVRLPSRGMREFHLGEVATFASWSWW